MVKGISRQVIVVHAPEPKLFEQAIFILREDVDAVTDDQLLKEANRLLKESDRGKNRRRGMPALWAAAGAFATGLAWVLTLLI